jgi:transposase
MKSNENEILRPGLSSGPGLGPGPAGPGPGLDETPGIGIGIGIGQEPVPIPEPILNAYYLGGDASKGYCDFIILDQFKQVVEDNFQLDDTFEGHQALFKVLEEFFRKHPATVLYAGFESTGGYENNWYNFLWQLHSKGRFNIGVTRLNPYGVRHHKEASLERIDTDKISARKIASYLISYPEKVEYNKEDNLSFLRMHWKTIRLMKKQYIQWVTQLKSQLYVLHPQLLTYCVEGMPAWVLQVVTKYPTAFRLARANAKTLAKVPYVTEKRAEELIEDAKKSVASISTAHPNVEHFIRTSAYQVLNLGRTTAEQEVKMMEGYQSHFPNSEMEILVSFPGIAQYSAFGLLIEIGSIHRFSSVKHLVSFFGIHPVYRKSGDGTWGMHMSKKGRKEPRWILFNVARSAIGCNDMIRELYNGYVAKGKSKMAALGMIMHKILRIIYGMLKNNKKYDPQIDIANRKKKNSQQKNQDNKTDKNRRYQGNDPNAPISGRQTKKRKKEKEEVN